MPANASDKANWASFPIPSQNGPNAAPVFAGGSDLAVFKTTKYPQASWDLIQIMDSEPNSTSFANLQGFFPPYTAQLTGGKYKSDPLMAGFATAATNTQISPSMTRRGASAPRRVAPPEARPRSPCANAGLCSSDAAVWPLTCSYSRPRR